MDGGKTGMEVARVLCIAVSHKRQYYRSHNGHVKYNVLF